MKKLLFHSYLFASCILIVGCSLNRHKGVDVEKRGFKRDSVLVKMLMSDIFISNWDEETQRYLQYVLEHTPDEDPSIDNIAIELAILDHSRNTAGEYRFSRKDFVDNVVLLRPDLLDLDTLQIIERYDEQLVNYLYVKSKQYRAVEKYVRRHDNWEKVKENILGNGSADIFSGLLQVDTKNALNLHPFGNIMMTNICKKGIYVNAIITVYDDHYEYLERFFK